MEERVIEDELGESCYFFFLIHSPFEVLSLEKALKVH